MDASVAELDQKLGEDIGKVRGGMMSGGDEVYFNCQS